MIKEELMSMLRNELPVLRARLGISQAKLAEMIGISRQTYNVRCSFYCKECLIIWNVKSTTFFRIYS